jgi:hypothetical protein
MRIEMQLDTLPANLRTKQGGIQSPMDDEGGMVEQISRLRAGKAFLALAQGFQRVEAHINKILMHCQASAPTHDVKAIHEAPRTREGTIRGQVEDGTFHYILPCPPSISSGDKKLMDSVFLMLRSQWAIASIIASPVRTATLPEWAKDEAFSNCTLCSTEYGFFTRRHHCRLCGGVFCGNCSTARSDLSKFNMTNVRLCILCFGMLNSKRWSGIQESRIKKVGKALMGSVWENSSHSISIPEEADLEVSDLPRSRSVVVNFDTVEPRSR